MSAGGTLASVIGPRPPPPIDAARARQRAVYRRWPVVVVCLIALAGLYRASLAEVGRPPHLGLRAEMRGGNAVIVWVQPGGHAWDVGIRPGGIIVAIDGQPPAAGSIGDTMSADTVTVLTQANALLSATAHATPALESGAARLGFPAIALCFFMVGAVVFLLAADARIATCFLGFATVTATALLAAPGTSRGATWLLAIEFVAVVGAGATTVLLFLVFPIDRLHTRFGRWMAACCLVAAAGLVGAYGWAVFADSSVYAVVQRAAFTVLLVEFLIAGGLVAAALVATSPGRRRARQLLLVVALGNIAGLVPFCLLVLVPALLGQPYIEAPDLAILSVVLVPLSLGTAVLSREFIAMARLLHRGVIAVSVWTVLLAAYSTALVVLHDLLVAWQPRAGSTQAWIALSVAVAGGSFPVAQGQLRRALEQLVFRDTYHYAETLRRLSAEIVHLRSVERIAAHVLGRLVATLDLRWAALALAADGSPGARYRAISAHATAPGRDDDSDAVRNIPLVADGMAIGSLTTSAKRQDDDYLPADHALLDTLTPLVATSVQNALLLQRLEGQLQALAAREQALAALSERLMRVQEEERLHLALDLHDDPLQRAIQLTRELSNAPFDARVWGWRKEVEEIATALRAVCAGLHPPLLSDFGLAVGIEQLVNDVRARADLLIRLVVEGLAGEPPYRLDPDVEVAIYRVAQEALNNCLKHAGASEIEVTLARDQRRLTLMVADNGRGLPADMQTRAAAHAHLGILGMRERLRPWDGVVTIGNRPCGGTIVTAMLTLPIRAKGGPDVDGDAWRTDG